jgi:hypothetical protein
MGTVYLGCFAGLPVPSFFFCEGFLVLFRLLLLPSGGAWGHVSAGVYLIILGTSICFAEGYAVLGVHLPHYVEVRVRAEGCLRVLYTEYAHREYVRKYV